MYDLDDVISEELEKMKRLRSELRGAERDRKKRIGSKLDGYHLVAENRKSGFVYWAVGVDGDKRYIRAKDRELARALAQREYNGKVADVLDERILLLGRMKEECRKTGMEYFYESIPPARKALIDPIWISDEEYAARWQAETYYSNSYPFDEDTVFMTNRGERVRSKSEKILADLFNDREIPYRYEPELCLESGRTVFPDFVVLNKKKRREYVWEHFGLMSDPDYAEKAKRKLLEYEGSGYIVGINLIYTEEMTGHGIHQDAIEKRIDAFLVD